MNLIEGLQFTAIIGIAALIGGIYTKWVIDEEKKRNK